MDILSPLIAASPRVVVVVVVVVVVAVAVYYPPLIVASRRECLITKILKEVLSSAKFSFPVISFIVFPCQKNL